MPDDFEFFHDVEVPSAANPAVNLIIPAGMWSVDWTQLVTNANNQADLECTVTQPNIAVHTILRSLWSSYEARLCQEEVSNYTGRNRSNIPS